MKSRRDNLTAKINNSLNSLEELISTLEQKKNDVSRGIFRKEEFKEINSDYLFTLSRLESLGEHTLEYEERYESLIKRSEILFSKYIEYYKSRFVPLKRKKPTHYKDDFSEGVDDPRRSGIKIIPMQDFDTDIQQYSSSDY